MGISGGIDSALTACIAADAIGKENVNAVSMPSRYSSTGHQGRRPRDRRAAGGELQGDPHRDHLRGVSGDSRAPFRRRASRGDRAEHPGPHPRQHADGALQQVRLPGADHRQQERDGRGLRHPLRRHGRRLRRRSRTCPRRWSTGWPRIATRSGPGEGPIPQATIDRAPSAELAADQTDQDTLPPYDLLDRIIEAYVVDDDSVEEIAASGIDRAEVQRVVAMIDGNEYKRRQAAPGRAHHAEGLRQGPPAAHHQPVSG